MNAAPMVNILIVDDVQENRKIAEIALKMNGYQCHSVENGMLALEYVANHQVDLILLDIMMPIMDGYATCRELKKMPQSADIPVIFVTGVSDIRSVTEGFAIGGVDYITKPFMREELLARVKTHLSIRKLQAEQVDLIECMNDHYEQLQQQAEQLQNQSLSLENITNMALEYQRTQLAEMEKIIIELREQGGKDTIPQFAERLDNLREKMDMMLQGIVTMTERIE